MNLNSLINSFYISIVKCNKHLCKMKFFQIVFVIFFMSMMALFLSVSAHESFDQELNANKNVTHNL